MAMIPEWTSATTLPETHNPDIPPHLVKATPLSGSWAPEGTPAIPRLDDKLSQVASATPVARVSDIGKFSIHAAGRSNRDTQATREYFVVIYTATKHCKALLTSQNKATGQLYVKEVLGHPPHVKPGSRRIARAGRTFCRRWRLSVSRPSLAGAPQGRQHPLPSSVELLQQWLAESRR